MYTLGKCIGSWYITTERVMMEGQAAVVVPDMKNCFGPVVGVHCG